MNKEIPLYMVTKYSFYCNNLRQIKIESYEEFILSTNTLEMNRLNVEILIRSTQLYHISQA